MSSQAFHPFEVESPQPFMLRDILPGPAWAPFRATPPAPAACPIVSVSKPAQPAANKTQQRWATVLAAVGFEVAIPLGVFGIWQFWIHAR